MTSIKWKDKFEALCQHTSTRALTTGLCGARYYCPSRERSAQAFDQYAQAHTRKECKTCSLVVSLHECFSFGLVCDFVAGWSGPSHQRDDFCSVTGALLPRTYSLGTTIILVITFVFYVSNSFGTKIVDIFIREILSDPFFGPSGHFPSRCFVSLLRYLLGWLFVLSRCVHFWFNCDDVKRFIIVLQDICHDERHHYVQTNIYL